MSGARSPLRGAVGVTLALLTCVGAGTRAESGKPFVTPDERALDAAIAKAASTPLSHRIVEVTEPLVGAPYVLSPLGEGSGPDKDPRMRLDAFDCTTFVETAIALSLSPDVEGARARLDQIRYKGGAPSFVSRRHFPEAEWIPELIELGYLEDITRQIGGDATVRVEKRLDPQVWSKRRKKILSELPEDRIPNGTFRLDVLPLDVARAKMNRIPSGTVLSAVREDYRSIPVRVSHQGLVIVKDGKRYIRHAADRVYHRVVDEPLSWYLARNQKYRKWPVVGVHLARVRAPADVDAAHAPAR